MGFCSIHGCLSNQKELLLITRLYMDLPVYSSSPQKANIVTALPHSVQKAKQVVTYKYTNTPLQLRPFLQ